MSALHRIIELLERQVGQNDRIIALLATLTKQESSTMKSIEDLKADVEALQSVDGGAIVLLEGLSAKIAALKSTTTDAATAREIDALAGQVEATKEAMAAAIVANTPADDSTTAGAATGPLNSATDGAQAGSGDGSDAAAAAGTGDAGDGSTGTAGDAT